ncbi:MAG: AraC family transcriptional regulator [Deltaproteobacteria bacterium]|nr:AraC family transcriptional regulator [Deltaproteobacteria bacterium]
MVVESDPGTGSYGSLNAILPLLEYLESEGFDLKAILNRAGVPESALEDIRKRLPKGNLEALWQVASQVTGDPAVALRVSTMAKANTLGIIGYLASASETVRTALEIVKDLTPLLLEDVECELESDGEVAFFRCSTDRNPQTSHFIMEYAIGLTVTMSRVIGAAGTDPLEASFSYPAPAHADEYERILQLPIRFDARDSGVLYPISMMDGSNPSADAALRQVLEQYAAEQLARIPSAARFSQRVRAYIHSMLPLGGLTANTVAARFSVSGRTLRRRLQEEATSYHEILDDVRSELARHYLAKEKRGIDEVAFVLGFSDPSAFTKAFRRWTGKTPADFARASNRIGQLGEGGG